MTSDGLMVKRPAGGSRSGPIRRPLRKQRGGREPLIVLAFLGFIATLPLEWLTLTRVGSGVIKPFHVSALVFIVACLARWRPGRLLRPVVNRHIAVYGAYFVLLGAAFAGGLAYADPYLTRDTVGRQLFYAVTSIVVAGFLVIVIGRRPQRGIAGAGLLTFVIVLLAIAAASAAQHVNAFSVLGDALAQQNPDLITYRLLRTAFRSDADLAEVGANLRHKVFLGLLLAAFLGLACTTILERRQRVTKGLLVSGSVLGFGFVVLSLSRSTILCLLLTLLLFPLRMLIRKRARSAHAASVALAVALMLAIGLSPVGELLYTRFITSTSYDARITGAGSSFLSQFEGAALAGTQQSAVAQSPHNLVLNSWLAGGIVAAAAAAVMLLAFARLWAREVRRYVTGDRGWVLPVAHVWVIGIGIIPLVRSVTAGNQFHMVEWVAVGVFLGMTLANERAATTRELVRPRSRAAGPNGSNGQRVAAHRRLEQPASAFRDVAAGAAPSTGLGRDRPRFESR